MARGLARYMNRLDPWAQRAFKELDVAENNHPWRLTRNCKHEALNLLDRTRALATAKPGALPSAVLKGEFSLEGIV
jgi:hypothetical protein